MRTQWTTKGNRDAGSSCSCGRGLHRYLRNFGGGGVVETPKTSPSVRHCPTVCLEKLGKTHHKFRRHGRDSNRGSVHHNSTALPLAQPLLYGQNSPWKSTLSIISFILSVVTTQRNHPWHMFMSSLPKLSVECKRIQTALDRTVTVIRILYTVF